LDQLGDNISLKNYDFPTPVDNNFIAFGALKFKLSRVIHSFARRVALFSSLMEFDISITTSGKKY
jgi:hypothetical protein